MPWPGCGLRLGKISLALTQALALRRGMDSETPAKRRILRYSNRKMYDPETSRYVTAEGIVQFVKDGVPVEVIGCTDHKNYTTIVLCSVLNRIARLPQANLDENLLLQAIGTYSADAAPT